MKYGYWRVTIGSTSSGAPIIGARACKEYGAVVTDKVFGAQLPHRVTARDGAGGVHICTPTEAHKKGWDIVGRFLSRAGN